MTEMPRSKRAKAMDEGDRISSLPDELRRHVLSFLPARDTVRTSVLAPKWRHLWASARRLNVDAKGFSSQSSFVNDTVCLWICHALRSNVEELSVIDHDCNDISERVEYTEFFRLQHYPLTSSYLKKLHLCYVYISNRFLKTLFSGCPALEDLEMINCDIFYTDFTSATLKSLSIDYVHFPNPSIYDDLDYDIVINMLSLVSLHIGALLVGAALSLVDMQSLATASIYLDAFTYLMAAQFSVLFQT
ncbi:putative F-box/LRR-repeat protein At3g18150 [Panicum virgatum]|uniref:F-box domain-containing protein n=1 Tax=Panicum virgatum TaxID=38727 RepID=A0A8T0R8Y1_PANVG|nr:putative F-box/LRR-repeat protein At3g18150 [Panicum virgatum]KAG2581568.1 hypothetical protein PVAP13_6KG045200 [Panicum virgatum]